MFKNKYGIDDQAFTELRWDLKLRDGNLYYKDADIMRKDGRGLYSLTSIKGKGAAEFKNIIKYGKQRVQKRLIEKARWGKQLIEPKVVDRQSRTFDNQAFDGGDDYDISKDARLALKKDEDSGIPQAESIEMYELTENLRKKKSKMGKVYEELRIEEEDIGLIKEELKRERARDEPDQNKIKDLEEEIRQLEEPYFAKQGEYRDYENQVERIRAILTSEKPLGERLRELFKKEGITIISIITAIGMIISTIALAITNLVSSAKPVAPTPKPSPSPPPSPSPGRSFID